MLRGGLAQTDVRECETAQRPRRGDRTFSLRYRNFERALLQPKLEAALAAFGARAIRIGDGAGIDLGKLANELPPQFGRARPSRLPPKRPRRRASLKPSA